MPRRSLSRCLLAALALLFGCNRNLELPPPPGPVPPGLVYGRLVYAKPGRAQPLPAAGGVVQLMSTSLSAQADAEGRFTLEGLSQKEGTLWFRFDADGDGKVDRQKMVKLSELGAGPGRQLSLGEVVLGRNAQVHGKVLRADRATAAGGHAGTSVFVPEGPYVTATADDGTFTLTELPEGPLKLGAFRPGYDMGMVDDLSLRSGEDFALRDLLLPLATAPAAKGSLSGTVVLQPPPASLAGTLVTASSGATPFTAQTDATGAYRFSDLPVGRYDLMISRPGYATAVVYNAMVSAGGESQQAPVLVSPGQAPDAGLPPPFDAGFIPVDDGGWNLDSGLPPPDAGRTCPTGDGGRNAPWAVLTSAVVAAGELGQLVGAGSFDPDCQPLEYHWSQDGGPAVALSDNHSLAAASPTFLAPDASVQLRFVLSVTDPDGLTSAPAAATVSVLRRPSAAITPTLANASVGQAVVLDASQSKDPQGLALTYRWTLVAGQGHFNGPTNGAQVQVVADTPGTLGVRVEVDNGFLGASAQAAVDTLSPVVVTVDAGAPQTVGYGDQVTLSGSVSSSRAGDTFNTFWSGPPNFPLTNVNGLTATFVAPRAPGPIQFRLTANRVSGAETYFAETTVNVEDRSPPTLLFTEPSGPGAQGSGLFAGAGFDEALDPASVTSSTVRVLDQAGNPVPADLVYDSQKQQVALVYKKALVPGASYTFQLGAVTDQSPRKNALSPKTLSFVAADLRWPNPVRSTMTSNGELRAGLVHSSQGAVAFGRRQDFNGGSLTTVSEQMNEPTPWQAVPDGGVPTYKRGLVVGEKSYALLRAPDQATPGVWMVRRQSGGGPGGPDGGTAPMVTWSPLAPPPGPVFSDGTSVYSLWGYATDLKLASYDATLDRWPTTNLGELVSNQVGGFRPDAPGAGGVHNGAIVVAGLDTGGNVWVNSRPQSGTSWSAIGTSPTNGATEVRLVFASGQPFVAAARNVSGNPSVDGYWWNGISWIPYANAAGGPASAFDVVGRGDTVYLVAAVNGSLVMRRLEINAANPTFLQVVGPSNGTLNESSGCTAAYPELHSATDRLYVAWSESCNAGQWTLLLRRIE